MICKEANELITALVDNELLDLERQAVEGHLKNCLNCRNIYQQEQELKRHLHTIGDRVATPPKLINRILSDPRISPRPAIPQQGWQGWMDLLWPVRVMARPAFALALLILLLVPTFYLMWPTGGSISLAALEAHAKINSGDLSFTQAASKQELKNHLVRSVEGRFAPMGHDLSAVGLKPVGGLLHEVGDRKVLVAVYRGTAPSVSCFTYMGTEKDAPPQARKIVDAVKKINYYTFTDGNMNGVMHRVGKRICLLVSKMPMDKLLNIARAVPQPIQS